MTKKRRPFTYPAFLEVLSDDGQGAFATTEDVLASPKLQAQLVNKRAFTRLKNRMRKRGMLYEVPYIGPKDS